MAIGLVMILEMTPPHKTSMLNPFHAELIHAEEVREVATTNSPLMVFTSWFHGRCVRWDDQESEGFYKVMAYFPGNFVNLAPIFDEVHLTNHGSILSIILICVEEECDQAVQ
uniref:Uncharacterized protein n=1 Tax=Oryza rufipogon TaxID=4529 RepID=A0A0E0QJJ7_ORYRU